MWKFVGRSSQEKRDEILFFSFSQKELNKDVESRRRTDGPTKQQCCRVMETGHTTGRAIMCQEKVNQTSGWKEGIKIQENRGAVIAARPFGAPNSTYKDLPDCEACWYLPFHPSLHFLFTFEIPADFWRVCWLTSYTAKALLRSLSLFRGGILRSNEPMEFLHPRTMNRRLSPPHRW